MFVLSPAAFVLQTKTQSLAARGVLERDGGCTAWTLCDHRRASLFLHTHTHTHFLCFLRFVFGSFACARAPACAQSQQGPALQRALNYVHRTVALQRHAAVVLCLFAPRGCTCCVRARTETCAPPPSPPAARRLQRTHSFFHRANYSKTRPAANTKTSARPSSSSTPLLHTTSLHRPRA